MDTLHTILCATDLSPGARQATERAAALAHDTHGALHLAHALHLPALEELRRWVNGDELAALPYEEDARALLTLAARDLSARHGTPATEHLVAGHPVTAMAELADALAADLVCVSTRGAGFFRGAFVGTTAERIALLSRRPVLMVRNPCRSAYQRVLVPVDFSRWSLQALQLAHRIAPQATLVLMHATELVAEGKMRVAGVADHVLRHYQEQARYGAQQALQALVARSGVPPERVETRVATGADPWMLIAEQEQAQDCDLVVIGRQGRSAIAETLLGSTTRMVLSECASDVVVSVVADALGDTDPPR